jgi:hypothetical protein
MVQAPRTTKTSASSAAGATDTTPGTETRARSTSAREAGWPDRRTGAGKAAQRMRAVERAAAKPSDGAEKPVAATTRGRRTIAAGAAGRAGAADWGAESADVGIGVEMDADVDADVDVGLGSIRAMTAARRVATSSAEGLDDAARTAARAVGLACSTARAGAEEAMLRKARAAGSWTGWSGDNTKEASPEITSAFAAITGLGWVRSREQVSRAGGTYTVARSRSERAELLSKRLGHRKLDGLERGGEMTAVTQQTRVDRITLVVQCSECPVGLKTVKLCKQLASSSLSGPTLL